MALVIVHSVTATGSPLIGASDWNANHTITGTVDVGQITATGTASSTTFLRGDGSWQLPSGGSSDAAQVYLTAIAYGV